MSPVCVKAVVARKFLGCPRVAAAAHVEVAGGDTRATSLFSNFFAWSSQSLPFSLFFGGCPRLCLVLFYFVSCCLFLMFFVVCVVNIVYSCFFFGYCGLLFAS